MFAFSSRGILLDFQVGGFIETAEKKYEQFRFDRGFLNVQPLAAGRG
jgi:hypothetical protein